MQQFSFRDAAESDVEGIMKVHLDSIKKICSSHYSQEKIDRWVGAQSLERYSSFVTSGDDFVLVVDSEEEVVAFGHMGKRKLKEFSELIDYEVFGFYVSPRVVRRGVGRMLYKELEQRAKTKGAQGIGIHSSSNAIPFYESCGFTKMGTAEVKTLQVQCTVMEKLITK